MSKFKYKAKKGANEIIEGFLSADSQTEAINKLIEQRLSPLEVELYSLNQSKKTASRGLKPIKRFLGPVFLAKTVNSKEVFMFTQKLAILMRAKTELFSGLKIIRNQTANPFFQNIISDINDLIKKGSSFSMALSNYPQIFSPLFIGAIKAGEVSGDMGKALTYLADFLQQKEKLKGKITGALVYPVILLFIGIVSIFVILNFVVPRLRGVIEETSAAIPFMTKVVLRASQISSDYYPWMLCVVIAVALILLKRKSAFVRFLNLVTTKLPIVKDLFKNQELANFSQSFSLLIHGGVAPLDSLEVARLSLRDMKMKQELTEVIKKVRDGQLVSASFNDTSSFPSFFVEMLSIGEESGRLEEVLDEVNKSCLFEVESSVAVITSVLEPLLILILGIVLGAVVFSVLLPIFQITDMIQ